MCLNVRAIDAWNNVVSKIKFSPALQYNESIKFIEIRAGEFNCVYGF